MIMPRSLACLTPVPALTAGFAVAKENSLGRVRVGLDWTWHSRLEGGLRRLCYQWLHCQSLLY
jgi:hypothetical protein